MKKSSLLLLVILILSLMSVGCSFDRISNKITRINEENSYKKPSNIPVLAYHVIVDEEDLKATDYQNKKKKKLASTVVLTEDFENQMNYLKANDYTTLSLEEFYGYMQKGLNVPENSVLITFDDGRKEVIENALPILRKNKQRAVMFLITSKMPVKTEKYKPGMTQFISKEEMQSTKAVFEYQLHTNNLHDRSKDGKPMLLSESNDKIKKDLEKNIELTGDNTAFAYPFGEGFENHQVKKHLKELGVKMAFTTESKHAAPGDDVLAIGRKIVYPTTKLKTFKNLVANSIKKEQGNDVYEDNPKK